jgi:hypothetical protein
LVGGFTRSTFTNLYNDFLDSTGNTGLGTATLKTFFTRHLGLKYQAMQAELSIFKNQKQATQDTVAAQQYYKNPIDLKSFENLTVTVGSIAYPLIAISSQDKWDRLNQTLISVTTIPQYCFPRRDDFGIWPIPQAVYVITENYIYRDRNLLNDDVSATVGVTINDATVTSTASFTAGMVGRWMQISDDGYWYRIGTFTSTSSIELDRTYQGTTNATATANIGETPELPEELHEILGWGVLADFYALYKKDKDAFTYWNNYYMTGDPLNADRTGRNIQGGLIGARNRYSGRSDSKIARHLNVGQLKSNYPWGISLTM